MRHCSWPPKCLIVLALLSIGASAASAFEVRTKVCNTTGNPVPNVQVEMTRRSPLEVVSGTTGSNGIYTFSFTNPVQGEVFDYEIINGSAVSLGCCYVDWVNGSPLMVYMESCRGGNDIGLCDPGVSTINGVLEVRYAITWN